MKNHFRAIVALLSALAFAAPVSANTVVAKPASLLPAIILAPSAAHPQTFVALTHSARYSFLTPRQWSMELEEKNKTIRIKDPGQQAQITIRFSDDSGGKGQDDFAKWHLELQQAHTSAQLRENFTLEVGSATAGVADLIWVHAEAIALSGRFARIPVPNGYLELSLVAPAENFEAFLPAFMQLLGSLRLAALTDPLEIRSQRPE